MPVQLSNQHQEWKRGLALHGSHGHFLLYEESKVNALLGYDRPKVGRLRGMEDRLI